MRSIRTRLLVSLVSVMVLALGLFCGFAYFQVKEKLVIDFDQTIGDKASLLANSIHYPDREIHDWTDRYLRLDRQQLFAQIFDTDGNFVEKVGPLENPVPISSYAMSRAPDRGDVVIETHSDAAGKKYRIATCTKQYTQGIWAYTQVGIAFDVIEGRAKSVLYWMILGSAVTILLTVLLASLMINRWMLSLTAATKTAREIGAQNLSRQRLFVAPDDAELANLATAFNELLDRLEASHQTQQRFVADASHELRTPLTVLRGEIEVTLRRERPIDEYRDVLRSNKEEIESMSRMVENLLALAHADAGEALGSREPVELTRVIQEVAEKLRPLAHDQKVQLEMDIQDDVIVAGDEYSLGRVILNLVENGIRYTPAEEFVRVRVTADAMDVKIAVEDTGPGIPREHLPHLFERFYRVDKGRSREFGGAGLGLSIVQALVKAHGGEIKVKSELGKGTVFVVTLPRA